MDRSDFERNPGFHVRPAQLGDICVMLEPTEKEDLNQLDFLQSALQEHFGGIPVKPVHLTCQRFSCSDLHRLQEFTQCLAEVLAPVCPGSMTALSLQSLCLPGRVTATLKWCIDVTQELRLFVSALEQALQVTGIKPLYTNGAASSLVTALRKVPRLHEARIPGYRGFPQHLFSVGQIELSEIRGPDEFEILTRIPVSRKFQNTDS